MNLETATASAVAPAPPATIPDAGATIPKDISSAAEMRSYGVRTYESLRRHIQNAGRKAHLIEDLLPMRSIGLLVGDSGIGKSPLLYQMAVSIAAGVPFLGFPTHKGSVLYFDFENPGDAQVELATRVSTLLELPEVPSDSLWLWNVTDCTENFGTEGCRIPDIIQKLGPKLAIIDSLSAWRPDAEEKNSAASAMIAQLRIAIRKTGGTLLLTHHRRKPSLEGSPSLLDDPRAWFRDTRGASALINGIDVRLGLAPVSSSGASAGLKPGSREMPELLFAGFQRIRGDIGPIYLARKRDEDAEPLGYVRATLGAEALNNTAQSTAYQSLPASFSTGDARRAYVKGDQATSDFLAKCTRMGLLKRVGRGQWQKISLE